MTASITKADVLYHYCSIETLYHILNSQSLRLSNIRYMNDCKEISWLFELAKHAILNRKAARLSNEEHKLCQVLLHHCDNLFLDESFFPTMFCTCFSRKADSLSQWRAYANDGRGVAIGFDREYLNSFTTRSCTQLADIEYLSDSDLAQIESELDGAFSKLKRSSHPLSDDEISLVATEVEQLWDGRAPLCKNPAFHEEDEVRLLHVGSVNEQWSAKTRIGPIKFYPRNDVIVPYIDLALNPEAKPIAKIVLGPRSRVEHSRWGIMEFARSKGFQLARDQFEVSTASYGEFRRLAR